MQCSHSFQHSGSLRALQKVSEEEGIWPDEVGIRHKAWGEPVEWAVFKFSYVVGYSLNYA